MTERLRVLLVGHDAGRTGAPINLLRFMRWLGENNLADMHLLLDAGGPLEAEYAALAPVTIAEFTPGRLQRILRFILRKDVVAQWMARRVQQRLIDRFKPDLVFLNSSAAAAVACRIDAGTIPIVCRVAELKVSLLEYEFTPDFDRIASCATHFIAVSQAVANTLQREYAIPRDRISIVPGMLPSPRRIEAARDMGCTSRRRLGFDEDTTIVGAVGTHNWQKSPELFVMAAREALRRSRGKLAFVWIGGSVPPRIQHDIESMGLASAVHFLDAAPDALELMSSFDVFVLTSREDSFPLVMLEAAALGKPIVCFEGSGGAPEFVGDDCGIIVPYADTVAMAEAILQLTKSPALRAQLGAAAARKVQHRHQPDDTAARLWSILRRTVEPREAARVPSAFDEIPAVAVDG